MTQKTTQKAAIMAELVAAKLALAIGMEGMRPEPDSERQEPVLEGIEELRVVAATTYQALQRLVAAVELIVDDLAAPGLDALAKLVELRDLDGLTDEEFATQKARILD